MLSRQDQAGRIEPHDQGGTGQMVTGPQRVPTIDRAFDLPAVDHRGAMPPSGGVGAGPVGDLRHDEAGRSGLRSEPKRNQLYRRVTLLVAVPFEVSAMEP